MPNRPSLRRGGERERLLLEAVAKGHSMRAAAGIAGVSERTAWRHLERSPAARHDYELALQQAEAFLTSIVVGAAATDARHAEWLLARRWPGSYGERQQIDMAATVRGEYDVEVLSLAARYSGMTPEDTEAEIAKLGWVVPGEPAVVVGRITTEASRSPDTADTAADEMEAAPDAEPTAEPAPQAAWPAEHLPPLVTDGQREPLPALGMIQRPLYVEPLPPALPCRHCRGRIGHPHEPGCPQDGQIVILSPADDPRR